MSTTAPMKIAGGQPTAKWWAAFRVAVLTVALPLYNLAAARYGLPALTDADGAALVDAAGVAYLAVSTAIALGAAWWTRPRAQDAPVPDHAAN